MGERKGVNKYYPPDYDPARGGLNKWQGTHALRERARKLHMGILIIRFEMPYNIWCLGCDNHIGMGVRYNAEKSKVGMYYTTPIYKFRMKCHLCDNHFEIQTDPGNMDYVVLSGARRQEKRFDPAENGTVVPDERSKIQRLSTDGMFQLLHGEQDRSKLKEAAPNLQRLHQLQTRLHDDYSANSALRKKFRTEKKADAADAARDAALLKKSSLDIQLLPETDQDRRLASLMRLHDPIGSECRQRELRQKIMTTPVLSSSSSSRNAGFLSAGRSSSRSCSIGVQPRQRNIAPSNNDSSNESPPSKNESSNESPPSKNEASNESPSNNDSSNESPSNNDSSNESPSKNDSSNESPSKNDSSYESASKNDSSNESPPSKNDSSNESADCSEAHSDSAKCESKSIEASSSSSYCSFRSSCGGGSGVLHSLVGDYSSSGSESS